MSPQFEVAFGWFLLVGVPLLALAMTWESQRLARKMGERYTLAMAVTDNQAAVLLFALSFKCVQRAHLVPENFSVTMTVLLSCAALLLYGAIFGPRELTMQRWTKWKIGKEREQGSDETKERAQRYLHWMPFTVFGAFLMAAGLYVWAKGPRPTTLLAIAIVFVVCAIAGFFVVRQRRREIEKM